MLSENDRKPFFVPPKIFQTYTDFQQTSETASYKVFEATTIKTHEKHTIRILDPTNGLVANNFDLMATLFIQELLHLQNRCPGSVLINTLEISTDRKQIACAVRQLDKIQELTDLKNPKTIEKLLNDVLSDVEFLWKDLQMRNIASIIEPENIYLMKDKGDFFLGNWDKTLGKSMMEPTTLMATTEQELKSQDLAAEIKALAFALLKMKKVGIEELQTLQSNMKIDFATYSATVKTAVTEGFSDSKRLQELIERMLSPDPQTLPHLEEFKIKEDKIQVFPQEETKKDTEQQKADVQAKSEESKITSSPITVIEYATPTLLAWCSYKKNISIVDFERKQSYANFVGLNISKPDAWAHLKEIPNTKLLVFLHHEQNSANLEIFDISKKDQINNIYSFEEVSELTGWGDLAYNSRRNILGTIPVTGKIAYHLFNIDISKAGASVKLCRQSSWHPHYSTKNGNYITGFDFNPAGELAATIDRYGICLISDMNTNKYGFHTDMRSNNMGDYYSRCRWSTTGEPLLFVKYKWNKLNILDTEKKILTLRPSFITETSRSGVMSYWMDVCQSNGNLLAIGGDDCNIKIFDKRESRIVKTFDGIHSGRIDCVRWSPKGDMLATASEDKTANLIDFKTGKAFYTGNTPDGVDATSVCLI